jgi:putative DNA primase/helicase
MIKGCVDWQERGMVAPKAVTSATASYLEAEDAIAAWIDERCKRDPSSWWRAGILFESWSAWAEKAGEYVGSQRRFSERLEARGIQPQRKHEGRGFVGLRLLSPADDA